MGERAGRRAPIRPGGWLGGTLAPAVIVAGAVCSPLGCGLDWTVPEPETEGDSAGDKGGGHAHTSTTGAAGTSGDAPTATAAGTGGASGSAQSSSPASASSTSSSSSGSGSGSGSCDDQTGSCGDCESCADPICFADCYADNAVDGCAALDQCVNAFCAGDDQCVLTQCAPYYPSGAWRLYNDSVSCMYCDQCFDECGC